MPTKIVNIETRMKKLFYNNSMWLIALLLMLFSFSYSACKKSDDSCNAIITVEDSLGRPVANANLKLWSNAPPPKGSKLSDEQNQTGTTDSDGQAKFTFKLQAILNADAVGLLDSVSRKGSSIVKLEQGKEVPVTVIIR